MLRCGVGRTRLDEPFLFFRTNRHDDLVRRKGRESVADGETDVRLTCTSIDGLAGKLFGRAFGNPLRMTDRFLVVGEPVEHALPYDRHHDLDRVGLPDMRAQNVVRLFDGADDEDVLAHAGNVPPRRCGRIHIGLHAVASEFRTEWFRLKTTGGFMGIIAFIILGLLAGAIAKALLPGDDPGGFIVTAIIGIVGALIGGFIAGAIFDADPLDEFFDISTWLTAIVGSIILLLIYRMVVGRRSTSPGLR